MNAKPLGPFLGINNCLPDFALHKDKVGDFVREAVNVDVTNAGNFQRRKATTLLQPLTDSHSLYKNYIVIASSLYKITLPTYTQTLVKVLSSNAPMSYVEFNGDIYFSNGTDSGRIAATGIVYPWGMVTTGEPVVSTAGGELLPGYYQVAVAYMNSATGEEGGVSPSCNYNLSAGGGLNITLPGASAGATHINVYVSTANGAIPFYQTTVSIGTANLDITSLRSDTKRQAPQRYEQPLPAGTRIFIFNGQLCSVIGDTVYVGIPTRMGYCDATGGWLKFPSQVATAIGNQSGSYISTSELTYFFREQTLGSADVTVADVLPYGGVPGTEFMSPNKTLVGWFGNKGFVLADTQGEVQAVMSDNIATTVHESGVSTVLETRGYRRVVSCGYCMNLDNFSVTRYTDWDFTSTSQGYGTMTDGIYTLEATGDVDWSISLGKQNFGTEQLKHLPAVYLGCTSDEPLTLSVETPDGDIYNYDARSADTSTRIQRVDPGKGLRFNWYDLTLIGATDFTLASVSFAPVASQRRI